MSTKTSIIVQARMSSSRLPGKVLMPIAGLPMLAYQIERLRRVNRANLIIVATTTQIADDPIVAFCEAEEISFIRGSEHDVLSRYHKAAQHFSVTTVVRVTSDCPLIDPQLIDDAIAAFEDGSCDYVSNTIAPTWPYGMAVEVFSTKALAEAQTESRDASEREHVTPFIYWRPGRYQVRSLTRTPDLSQHRWTVDTLEDFELVRRIFETLHPTKPDFVMEDVLALLAEHPDWEDINRHVAQKTIAPQRTINYDAP
ncbi:cytidylyltransferase domain-containing protein [Azonexus sp. IMCC34839]|uniref:cytidylyltransferase domain-containing protein n=1 Tax=Azonexus sp. IMCC34839 TaxID=3133695 RepID=UPI00399A270E